MELIPAIDLLGDRAVRLRKGDYDDHVGGLDPLALARRWVGAGATRLHVVDLDGARAGEPRQAAMVARVVATAHEAVPTVRAQVAGGLRTLDSVAAAFDAGADAAVLGTAALTSPGFLAACSSRWPGRILASLDLRAGEIALDGWLRTGGEDPFLAAARLLADGASGLIVTDTLRDGTLSGPNLELLAAVRARFPSARLLAAGGVGSIGDLLALQRVGVDAAILGMALLTGEVDLGAGLAALGGRTAETGAAPGPRTQSAVAGESAGAVR